MLAAYPVAIHLLIASGRFTLAVSVLFGACCLSLLAAWRGRRRDAAAIALAFAAVGLASLIAQSPSALYLPPVAINLVLAIVFARSLAPGRVPVIERAVAQAQIDPGPLPDAQRRLARALTRIWVAFFALAAVAAVLLALYAPLEVWSLFTNVVYFVLVAGLVAAQHLYRLRRAGWQHVGSLRLLGRRLLRLG